MNVNMEKNCLLNYSQVSRDPQDATKLIANYLFSKIYPLILEIRKRLLTYNGELTEDDILKIQDVYTLCTSQIKKCLQTLFDIFKTEYHNGILMQDSRQYIFERLSWCINRLLSVEELLDLAQKLEDSSTYTILATPMYFVNWIDNTFDVLAKLANTVYKTDYKDAEGIYIQWKNDLVECVSLLHISIDELLLSAMTLCKYCLPGDQHIIRARCQVVLRETKALLSELIDGDLDLACKATPDLLKLPVMPSNVNVLIDVLKDVLYVLETNTNTALLTLLVHCFSNSVSPVDILKTHFLKSRETCSCHLKSENDISEDCCSVKEFDMYNERLMQIGSFAVSCSSDQNRILTLRSGMATLEALDPHLVPALMLSSDSHHTQLLVKTWREEVQEIRDSVFLIVDPAAFAEKSKQLMHQILLEIMNKNCYNNSEVCQVINIGCVVHEFFAVYCKYEPDALAQYEKLATLLVDLNKVQIECKIVSNLLSTGDDFVYNVKKIKTNKEVTLEQLIKRLKLLYTLVNRINSLFHPKDNEDQLFECELEDEPVIVKNITHTLHVKNANTYVHTPRKESNISRSIFARTTNIRSSTSNFPLSRLTKHMKINNREGLSFSVKLDQLFNLSDTDNKVMENNFVNKNLESIREPSVLYDFSPKKRNSLRKAVLNRRCKLPFDTEEWKDLVQTTTFTEKEDVIDEVTSLQITDILNQMDDITTFSSSQQNCKNKNPNVLSINVNEANVTISKHIWNISVKTNTEDMPLEDSAATDVTAPSNVTTLERINDIDLVESKLNSLKIELETSL